MTLCVAFHDQRAAYVLGDSLVTSATWHQPHGERSSVGETLVVDGGEFYAESVLKLWKGKRHVVAVAGDQATASTLVRKLNSSGARPENFVKHVERICGKAAQSIEILVAFVDSAGVPQINCWRPATGATAGAEYCAIGNTGASDLYNIAFRLGSEVQRYHDYTTMHILQTWVCGVQAAALKLRTVEAMEGIGGIFVGAIIERGGSFWMNDYTFSMFDTFPTSTAAETEPTATRDAIRNWDSLRSVSVHVRDHVTFVGPCIINKTAVIKAMPAIHLSKKDVLHRLERHGASVARAAVSRTSLAHAFMRTNDGSTLLVLNSADATLVDWQNKSQHIRLRSDAHLMLSSMPPAAIPDAVSVVIARASKQAVQGDAIVAGIMGNENVRFLTE